MQDTAKINHSSSHHTCSGIQQKAEFKNFLSSKGQDISLWGIYPRGSLHQAFCISGAPHKNIWIQIRFNDQIRSVAQLCPTLCNPMNRSMPGLAVHHQLPEFTQTHVHWVSDAIQPSHSMINHNKQYSNQGTQIHNPYSQWNWNWSLPFKILHLFVTVSVQFSRSVVSDSLQPHGLQHVRLPCPSPTPGAYSNSCPSSWWCHPSSQTLSSPSPPAFNLSQHEGLFKWVSSLHQVAKVLELQLQHQSFQWIFRTDFL